MSWIQVHITPNKKRKLEQVLKQKQTKIKNHNYTISNTTKDNNNNMPRSKSKPRKKKSSSDEEDDHDDENIAATTTTTTTTTTTSTTAAVEEPIDYSIKIKRDLVERVIQQLNELDVSLGNAEMAALNFFCERRLPSLVDGIVYDKNEDDEMRWNSVFQRIVAAFYANPTQPNDIDLLSRTLKYTEDTDGVYFICSHESFQPRIDSMPDDERMNLLRGVTSVNSADELDVRVLNLRFPKYSYRCGPGYICYRNGYNFQTLQGPPKNRNEQIEFHYDSKNGSKMVNEVDRCIRNLCKPFKSKSGGLSKRTDKSKAFYLMNQDGEIVLLNQALLSRCPILNDTTSTTLSSTTTTTTTSKKKNKKDFLYVCTHEAKGQDHDRRPLPVYTIFKFPMPIPQVIKIVYLLLLFWISGLKLSIKSFEYLGYGPILRESVCTVTFGYSLKSHFWYWLLYVIFFLILCFCVFTIRAKICLINLLGYGIKRTYFSWFIHSKTGILQKPSATSWFNPEQPSVGFVSKWKICFATLKDIFNQQSILSEPMEIVYEIYNTFFKDLCNGIGIATDSNRKEMEEKRKEGMMQIVYEEKNLLRFIVYRWVLPDDGKIATDEYENWETTLRSAIGVQTESQMAPDMVVSDHFSSGVNCKMGKDFLQNQKYNDYNVFRIHSSGTRCFSVGPETYFLYRFGTYFIILCSCWVWFDIAIPLLRPINGCWERGVNTALFQGGFINGTIIRFLWINTCASLALDIISSKMISTLGSNLLGFLFIFIFIFGNAVTFELFELVALITVCLRLYTIAEEHEKKNK